MQTKQFQFQVVDVLKITNHQFQTYHEIWNHQNQRQFELWNQL